MNNVQQHTPEITRDRTYRYGGTGGTPADALSPTRRDAALKRQRVEDWQQAIHEMLGWMSTPDQFDPQDQPDDAILETAIDYAADQIEEEEGDIAPDSIVLSGSGRIAMEWNDGAATAIIEFVQRGKAHFTLFVEGKVREKQVLVRNPESRKLELRG